MNDKGTVAILFGRRGSVGVPGKNTVSLLGRPCARYPLLAALNAESVHRTYVSTDDPKIRMLGRRLGAELINRPDELCGSDSPLEDAILHAYREVCAREGHPVERLVLLLANAPYVTAEVIDRAVQVLSEREDLDSVVSVAELNQYKPGRARKINAVGNLVPLGETDTNGERGAGGPVYFADGGLTVVRPSTLDAIESQPGPYRWQGANIGSVEQMANPGDIDQPWQIPAAEWWLTQHGFSRISTPYKINRPTRQALRQAVAQPTDLQAVRDKRVAVIGRAPYLFESGLGAEIDSADYVIRVNWFMPVAENLAPHVGSRTDLLYLLGARGRSEREAAAKACGVPSMVKNRALIQRLIVRAQASVRGAPFHPKYLPNTGTVCIFDCLQHGAAEVRAYGFDLHTSNTYADTGEEHNHREQWAAQREQNRRRTHDPEVDRRLLAGLVDSGARFVPDAVLSAVLDNADAPVAA